MRVFTSREVFPQTYTRGRGEVQLQKYKWVLHQSKGEAKEKNNSFFCLEIRPNCANGLIHTIKLEVPFASDFDAKILNVWDHCDDHPHFRDGTKAFEDSIHLVASWTTANLLLYDADVGPVYFQAGKKPMANEKEHRLWPRRHKVTSSLIGGTVGMDETHVSEPCLALVIDVDGAVAGSDATVIFGEISIEGQFPKHYSHKLSS